MYASKNKQTNKQGLCLQSLTVTAEEKGVQSSVIFLVSKGKRGPSDCMPHMQLTKVSSSKRNVHRMLGRLDRIVIK